MPGDRRGTFRSEPAPVALALIARVDGDARHAIDIALGLAPTVLAVHACDPAESRANTAFIREWEAGNLEVKLVLVAADPGGVGTEVADYIRRSFPRRPVHAIIGATPSAAHTLAATADLADRPAAQLQQALHDMPKVVVHWVMGKRSRRGRWQVRAGTSPSGREPDDGIRGAFHRPPDSATTTAANSRQQQRENTSLAFAIGRNSLLRDPGIIFALMSLAAVAAAVASDLAHLSADATTVALGSVTALVAQRAPLRWRLAGALVGWAILTGFAVNEYGVLTHNPQDLRRLALIFLLMAAVPPLTLRFRRALSRNRRGRNVRDGATRLARQR